MCKMTKFLHPKNYNVHISELLTPMVIICVWVIDFLQTCPNLCYSPMSFLDKMPPKLL